MLLKQRLVEPRLCWYNLMAVLLVLDMFHDFVAEVGAYFVVVMMMEQAMFRASFAVPGHAGAGRRVTLTGCRMHSNIRASHGAQRGPRLVPEGTSDVCRTLTMFRFSRPF